MQAAERDAWQREGWDWLTYPKSGQILEQDASDDPQWALVQLDFTTVHGAASYTVRVEVAHHIETEYSSHEASTHHYPQYQVTSMEKTLEQSVLSLQP